MHQRKVYDKLLDSYDVSKSLRVLGFLSEPVQKHPPHPMGKAEINVATSTNIHLFAPRSISQISRDTSKEYRDGSGKSGTSFHVIGHRPKR
jgi:hypothetical protein